MLVPAGPSMPLGDTHSPGTFPGKGTRRDKTYTVDLVSRMKELGSWGAVERHR